jgi:hypothetical protein
MASPLNALLERSGNPAIGAYKSLQPVQYPGLECQKAISLPLLVCRQKHIKLYFFTG